MTSRAEYMLRQATSAYEETESDPHMARVHLRVLLSHLEEDLREERALGLVTPST